MKISGGTQVLGRKSSLIWTTLYLLSSPVNKTNIPKLSQQTCIFNIENSNPSSIKTTGKTVEGQVPMIGC